MLSTSSRTVPTPTLLAREIAGLFAVPRRQVLRGSAALLLGKSVV